MMKFKLHYKEKKLSITFDKRETLELKKLFHVEIRGDRAFVINNFTGSVHKFNESGFFMCSKERVNKLKQTRGLIWL